MCDYYIKGDFRGKYINLGIEAKGLYDYALNYKDLKDKLLRSFELYDNVGLFIESGRYGLKIDSNNPLHAYLKIHIDNLSQETGNADVIRLAELHNSLHSFSQSGIMVYQLSSAAQFPLSIYSALIYLSNDVHNGLTPKKQDIYFTSVAMLSKIDGIGVKTAMKLLDELGNIYWCSMMSEDDLQDIIGKSNGSKVYNFLRSMEILDKKRKIKGYAKPADLMAELSKKNVKVDEDDEV